MFIENRFSAFVAGFAMIVLFPVDARATREDFLHETLVYATLQKGELEPEYWLDLHFQRKKGDPLFGHSLSLEYGIDEHWMVDLRTTLTSGSGNGFDVDSWRAEFRYRLAEERSLPVDIAFSAEANMEQEPDGSRSYGIEPRIIAGKYFGSFDVALNIAAEIPFNSAEMEFVPSIAVRYPFTRTVSGGMEVRYFGGEESASFIPQLLWDVTEDVTMKAGYALSTNAAVNSFARLSFEIDL